MRIDTIYDIGEYVYLKTDNEQKQRLIIQITIQPDKTLQYNVRCGTEDSWHYEIEINKEKDILKSI